MKQLLPIILFLLGCAEGRIAIVREATEIRFNVKPRPAPSWRA
jgi:hypothetical protein